MNSRDIHELVSRSVPKQAVLTHVSPRNGEVNDEIIKGVPVRIAYNGLVVEF